MIEVKICGDCKIEKSTIYFGLDKYTKDGFNMYCKECKNFRYNERRKNPATRTSLNNSKKDRRHKLSRYIYSVKENSCCPCGENTGCCLEFHHIDKTTKQYDIAKRPTTVISKIQEEIDKCAVICGNCHRKHHFSTDILEFNKKAIFIKTVKLLYGCITCGERDFRCLDFHHLEPQKKKYIIAKMYSYSLDNIIDEINKCILVCVNCHKKIHNNLICLEDSYEKISVAYNSDYITSFLQQRMVAA